MSGVNEVLLDLHKSFLKHEAVVKAYKEKIMQNINEQCWNCDNQIIETFESKYEHFSHPDDGPTIFCSQECVDIKEQYLDTKD